jgi:uncharacterized membrane protein HdeD (DUF308 family)
VDKLFDKFPLDHPCRIYLPEPPSSNQANGGLRKKRMYPHQYGTGEEVLNALTTTYTRSAGWSILLGVLLLLAGLLAIVAPFFAGIAASVFFGWLVLFAGIAHLVYAWSERGAGAILWQILIGIVYVIAALYMLVLPGRRCGRAYAGACLLHRG